MCSECQVADSTARQTGHPVVALVGRPNVGKSTLFSRLAGVHRKMGNWPATTVEVGTAVIDLGGTSVELIDLPGTASLSPISPDEQLACDLVVHGGVDVVVAMVDASNIARCLFLLGQVRELSAHVVVALTMPDIAERRGIHIDVDALQAELGLPVVPVVPRTGEGVGDIRSAIAHAVAAPHRPHSAPSFDDLAQAPARLAWVSSVMERVVRRDEEQPTLTDRVDRVVTAPVLGTIVLLAVFWAVFQATTSLAAPLQSALDSLINHSIGGWVDGRLSSLFPGALWLRGLVVDGVIAGVGTLLTFLPVMSIMFLLLAVLEDSGYMSRAAVVADHLMRIAGLPGKALLPLLVGFGCNVPAVAATRSVGDARHRILTGLVVPFTACSARLAVYVFVAGIFFGDRAGTVVFLMYLVSITLVVLGALLFRVLFFRGSHREPLLIELPPYRLPTTKFVFADAWLRVRGFLQEAGGLVVATVLIVWLLMSLPLGGGGTFANTPVANSAYGSISRVVAPVFAPAGFGDWHTTGALVTGFVAKEVVITSWAQNYALVDASQNFDRNTLEQDLRRDIGISSGGHPTAAILAFLIFLTAYTPCVATVAAQRREFGARWAAVGVLSQLLFAWGVAVAVFQVLRALGVG